MRDGDGEVKSGQQVLQAREVYVLMNDDYRISRNARSSWYLRNLNATLPFKQKEQKEQLSKSDDFEIISVIPTDDLDSREKCTNCFFCLSPSTIVTFLAHRYRLVFVLDTSPSLACLDDGPASGVLYDKVFVSLRNTLKSLVKPFCTPGSTLQLRPQLFISVVVHTTATSCRMKQVLLHGCLVTVENVDEILSKIQKELIQLESNLASCIARIMASRKDDEEELVRTSECSQIDYSLRTDLVEPQIAERTLLSADFNFVLMLRYGLLALQLLPQNCTSGIIVITDGVVGFPDYSAFETLMQQLRHDMVACSFVQVGSGFDISHNFGHLPYPELMQYMATATFGTFFSSIPRLTETGDPAMNTVHRGLLTRSFQRPLLDGQHCLKSRSSSSSSHENDLFHESIFRDSSTESSVAGQPLTLLPSIQKKYSENNLHVPLTGIVACRLRDGYSIRRVGMTKNAKGESHIEIQMVLPWRERVTILYVARSPWPLTATKCVTHVELITEATHDFFQETAAIVNQTKPVPGSFNQLKPVPAAVTNQTKPSPGRKWALQKYWESLHLTVQTDLRLVQLQSFSVSAVNFTVPDVLLCHGPHGPPGLPLFCLPVQSGEPQVNRQLNQRDPVIVEFVKFWKPVLTTETSLWHKWMHVHRIGIILEHDLPLGKHLHVPSSSGRHSAIYCRQAFEVVTDHLHTMSSFVLMEKHTYLSFIYGESEKIPTSFYVIRVDSKSPVIILRVAFLGGMPGKRRTQIMNQIKGDIASLKVQKEIEGRKISGRIEILPPPLLHHHQRQTPCCVITKKPIEKILIKYEKVPNDFNAMELISTSSSSVDNNRTSHHHHQTTTTSSFVSNVSRTALNVQTTLSNYLSHHRWIWSNQGQGQGQGQGRSQMITIQAVGKILSTLTKIRLAEGFHFAYSNAGILNLAIEVDMQPSLGHNPDESSKEPCTCVVQYVIFPPHDVILRNSVMSSYSQDELEYVDGDEPDEGALEIVTECWVEPQDGVAVTGSPYLKHFNGLDYRQLLECMMPFDYECISALVTFEHLGVICQHSETSLPPWNGGSSVTVTDTSNRGQGTSISAHLDHSIDHVAFPFDLFVLLSKSQQVELLFPTFKLADELKTEYELDVRSSNNLLFSLFLEQIRSLNDREIRISDDESLQFNRFVAGRKRDEPFQAFPTSSLSSETTGNQRRKGRTVSGDGSSTPPPAVTRWRCFVRSVGDTHLILTVVPASYRDVSTTLTSSSLTEHDDELSRATLENHDNDDKDDEEMLESNDERNAEKTPNVEIASDRETTKTEISVPSFFPLYVYDCLLNAVSDQLLNRWTYERLPDLYEDLTFQDDPPNIVIGASRSSECIARTRTFSGQTEGVRKRTSECENEGGGGGKECWKRNSNNDDIYKDQDDLRQHRTLILEAFLTCFVTGVYESLRQGRWMDSRDVDAAINKVCEETIPVEINVSRFLQTSCKQLQAMLEASAAAAPEDAASCGGGAKIIQDLSAPTTEFTFDERSEEAAPKLERPVQKVQLSNLLENHACEVSPGLHELLRNKFSQILMPHFEPVRSCPEYFYYCAHVSHRRAAESMTLDDDTGNGVVVSRQLEPGDAASCPAKDTTNPFFSECDVDVSKAERGTSVRTNASNVSSSDSVGDDATGSGRTERGRRSSCPLFVHLICSVHLPLGVLCSATVQNLTMCLSELADCLAEFASSEYDVNDLKVTLDMICLTLPPADSNLLLREENGGFRPSYSRMVSNVSQVSNMTDEESDFKSVPSSTILDGNKERLFDPVAHLPKYQQHSVMTCKDQILWLLEDEIVSSLRLVVPVTERSLWNVVMHVKRSSVGHDMCLTADVPLQFVYGPERSVEHFTESLEKLRVQKYRFTKEGDFYYLCKDRICDNVVEHANALSSALKSLGLASPLTMTSDSANKADTDVGTDAPVDTPSCDRDAVGFSEAAAVVVVAGESEQHEDDDDDKEEQAARATKDIQILVSRPSPIREVPVGSVKPPETLTTSELETASTRKTVCDGFSSNRPASSRDVMTTSSTADDDPILESGAAATDVARSSQEERTTVGEETKTDERIPDETKTTTVHVDDDVGSLEWDDNDDDDDAELRDATSTHDVSMAARSMSVSAVDAGSVRLATTQQPQAPGNARVVRVRPISGPAIFDVVRGKNQTSSIAENGFDATYAATSSSRCQPFHSYSQVNVSRDINMRPLTEFSNVNTVRGGGVGIKRAQSSISFEKLRPDGGAKQKLRHTSQGTSASECNTPQQAVDGRGALLRSRHTSGLETPISAVDTSSLASTGEAGYEGDSSDSDEEGAMMSFNESVSTVRRRLPIPDFWQLLRLDSDKVEVYFHTRDAFDNKSNQKHKELFKQVIDHIGRLCHSVNQKLLLHDLYEKNYCNILLVPEADEDIKWSRDVQQRTMKSSHNRRPVLSESSDSDNESPRDTRYLAATMQFMPGHFACECVFQTHFVLHSRLKMAAQRGPGSAGVQALMSVLDKFIVTNRKNMYVIRESTSGAVFYMRLSESSPDVKTSVQQPSVDSDDCKLSASCNASSLSTALQRSSRQETDDSSSTAGMTEIDPHLGSSLSFRTGSSQQRSRTEDRVTLSVFGVCPAGPEIKHDLVQVLQKKLDELVLDMITVALSRNAMSKLSVEDVQFIQKSDCTPVMTLQFLIPSSAILHQFALGYYLRQNLLQFLFTPKYVDSGRPENTFQDPESSGDAPVPDSDVFLYVRPPQSGGKGIACIFLSFVDCKGTPVQLLGSPKLSSCAYREPLDRSMFDSMLSTCQYKPSISPTKAPGPMSLIQFRIWECGTLDTAHLTDMLLQAIKHATSDIILEYRLLTAPICEVPTHYCKGMDSPMHSAPASPGLCAGSAESRHNQDATSSWRPGGVDIGRTVIKTPKETSSSIQTLLFDMFQSRSGIVEGTLTPEQMRNMAFNMSESLSESKQSVPEQQHLNEELVKKIQKYERGEKGVLAKAFVASIPDWLEHCCKLGVPAVSRYQYQLTSRFPIDYFLRESAVIVNNICQDMASAIFRSNDFIGSNHESSSEPIYSPYLQIRTANKDNNNSRAQVSLDFVKSTIGCFPGRSYSYVLVGRNVAEWRAIIDSLQDDGAASRCATPAKVHRKCQKFPSMELDSEGRATHSSAFLSNASSTSLDQMERVAVPRQRLLLMTLTDKQATLFLYNWASDLATTLDRQLMRQIQWHNARSHLLGCLVAQKMGLYQHSLFGDLPPSNENFSQEQNPFLLTVCDIDCLVKSTAIPTNQLTKNRNRSGSIAASRGSSLSSSHPSLLVPLGPQFDDLYRDIQPPVPMHKTTYAGLRDPLHRHGAQALELRTLEKKENEKRDKLQNLYRSWQQRTSSSPQPVSGDLLDLLKKSSRLIHYISTPLLFSPQRLTHGRHRGGPLPRRESLQRESGSRQQDPRSRHNSSASAKSKRSDSIDSNKKLASGASIDQAAGGTTGVGGQQDAEGHSWYNRLCQMFLGQYVEYLQTMSFVFINRQEMAVQGLTSDLDRSQKSNAKSSVTTSCSSAAAAYLQKSLPGGVILIELDFRDVYFSVIVYAFECSFLPVGKNVNQQLTVIFTDECDRFKELTHLHSFSHDFHVRLVESFVGGGGGHDLFPDVLLTSLLREIVSFFPSGDPRFSGNCVHEETVSIATGANTGEQLFDYMLNQENLHLVENVAMTSIVSEDVAISSSKDHRSALFCRLPTKYSDLKPVASRSNKTDSSTMSGSTIDVVITLDAGTSTPSDTDVVVATSLSSFDVRYWIVVTSRSWSFSRQNVEKKLTLSDAFQTKMTPASTPSVRIPGNVLNANEAVYSTVEDESRLDSVNHELRALVKETIERRVESTKTLCRRDQLWLRLQMSEPTEEEPRRRRKTGANDDETKDPHMIRMTCVELEDLLSLVAKVDVCDVDADLRLLLDLPLATYHSLVKILLNRFQDTCRYFSSHAAGGFTHYVILFNPHYADVFIMLSVNDQTQKANLCTVYRDPTLLCDDDDQGQKVEGLKQHFENVINASCCHLWTSMITQ